MSAEPAERTEQHQMIRLGGEDAVIVPMDEYRLLAALRKRATQQELDDASMDAAIAEHEAWEDAGRPGGTIPHEVVAAELLGGAR